MALRSTDNQNAAKKKVTVAVTDLKIMLAIIEPKVATLEKHLAETYHRLANVIGPNIIVDYRKSKLLRFDHSKQAMVEKRDGVFVWYTMYMDEVIQRWGLQAKINNLDETSNIHYENRFMQTSDTAHASNTLRPSDVRSTRFYEDLDPDKIMEYVLRRGWHQVLLGTKTEKWFKPPDPPKPTFNQTSHTKAPNATIATDNPTQEDVPGRDHAPDARSGHGTIIRIARRTVVDFGQTNKLALQAIEIYEDRWLHDILSDILSNDTINKTNEQTIICEVCHGTFPDHLIEAHLCQTVKT